MVFRETWKGRRKACRRMIQVECGKNPVLVTRLPLVGLAEAWLYDSKAWIFPGSGGLIVMDWSAFMRYVRRHL